MRFWCARRSSAGTVERSVSPEVDLFFLNKRVELWSCTSLHAHHSAGDKWAHNGHPLATMPPPSVRAFCLYSSVMQHENTFSVILFKTLQACCKRIWYSCSTEPLWCLSSTQRISMSTGPRRTWVLLLCESWLRTFVVIGKEILCSTGRDCSDKFSFRFSQGLTVKWNLLTRHATIFGKLIKRELVEIVHSFSGKDGTKRRGHQV